jgi:hypothetical protein
VHKTIRSSVLYVIFLSLVMVFSSDWAADEVSPEVADAIAQAPSPEDYPEAAAVVLFDRTVVEVDPQKKVTKNRHLLMKILHERGKDEYGDQTIRFDKQKQRVDILTARTHTAAGNIVEPEADGITETSASEVQWASAYSNAMQKNVHFPGLEPGAVIELKYSVSPVTEKGSEESEEESYFGGKVVFGSTDPILQKSFSLVIPNGMNASYLMARSDLRPKRTPMGDKQMLTWEMANIPQVIQEPSMVPVEDVVPCLVYSSENSWEELAAWFGKTYYKHLTHDKSINEFVDAQGWLDLPREEALKQTILYLVTNIRSVRLSLGLAGYEPLDEQVILDHKYGDCRDKVLLAIAFLRELGIEVNPFLINSSREDVADLPAAEQFDHIILAVNTGEDGFQWFDIMDDNAAYNYLPNHLAGAWGLMITPSGGYFYRTPDVALDENDVENVYRVTMSPSGDLTGTFEASCRGVFDRTVRRYFKDMKERESTMYFQQMVSAIQEGAKLGDFHTSDLKKLDEPADIELAFNAPQYGVLQGNVALFYLPTIPVKATDIQNYTSLPLIHYPVNVWHQGTVTYRLELTFPESLSVGYFPPSDSAENDLVAIRRTTELVGNHLTIDAEFTYKTPTIPPEYYAQAKNLYTILNRPQNWMVIFEH